MKLHGMLCNSTIFSWFFPKLNLKIQRFSYASFIFPTHMVNTHAPPMEIHDNETLLEIYCVKAERIFGSQQQKINEKYFIVYWKKKKKKLSHRCYTLNEKVFFIFKIWSCVVPLSSRCSLCVYCLRQGMEWKKAHFEKWKMLIAFLWGGWKIYYVARMGGRETKKIIDNKDQQVDVMQ